MTTSPKARAATTATQRQAPDAWLETRAQTALATQFVDEDDYLAVGKPDVGRATGADIHELFVSCDPAQAMQQQFEHLHPVFIAVHDLGTTSARKLLSGIAAASARSIQKLVIRRQGYGTPLASLEFIELPTAHGPVLRMYCTDADADTAARAGLVRVLLGFSRLGVIMVGDLPPHAIEAALRPMRDAMASGPWPNRQLLLLPLAAASTLVSHGIELSQGTGVSVRTTPQVTRPADAWTFITASWSRLGEESQPGAGGLPAPVEPRPAAMTNGRPATSAQANALPMRPMPTVPTPESRAALADAELLERYLRQLGELTGMLSCCIFDAASGREIAQAGTGPNATALALHGTELLSAMRTASRTLGLGDALPEAAISLAGHHLLLRELPRHPGLALHAVLDKSTANLNLVRLQIQRMDALFGDAVKA